MIDKHDDIYDDGYTMIDEKQRSFERELVNLKIVDTSALMIVQLSKFYQSPSFLLSVFFFTSFEIFDFLSSAFKFQIKSQSIFTSRIKLIIIVIDESDG